MVNNNNNGLGIFGWSKSEKKEDQIKRANASADQFIADQKARFGVDDIAFSTAKVFQKTVNEYVGVLMAKKYQTNGYPQYMVPQWDKRMTSEISRFITEAKASADASFDGELVNITEVERSAKCHNGKTYKYKVSSYKLRIPITSLPITSLPITSLPVDPATTGGITPEQLAELLANQNNNNAPVMATVDTSGDSIKTAGIVGGAVLTLGLIGAVIASKFKNKNKS